MVQKPKQQRSASTDVGGIVSGRRLDPNSILACRYFLIRPFQRFSMQLNFLPLDDSCELAVPAIVGLPAG
jgi:hypothetical protein